MGGVKEEKRRSIVGGNVIGSTSGKRVVCGKD